MAIARALVTESKLILADEPTGSLDNDNTQMVMNVLKKLNSDGKTIVIVTHDLKIAEQCDRIITLEDGLCT